MPSEASGVHAKTPYGRWQSTTMIGALRIDGSTACMAIDGATDAEVFRTFIGQVLAPTLRPGDTVVMDNLSAHKDELTLSLIRQAGADVLFLPAYSPDLTPIEKMWSKVKNALRTRGNQASQFRLLQYADGSNQRQGSSHQFTPPRCFVHDNQFGGKLSRQHDCLGFTRSKVRTHAWE